MVENEVKLVKSGEFCKKMLKNQRSVLLHQKNGKQSSKGLKKYMN